MEKHFQNYNTIKDWIDIAAAEKRPDQARSCESEYPHCGFHGVASKEEAVRLIREGYPEGLARMKLIVDEIYNLIRIPAFDYVFESAIEGSAPNVEAYLQGMPENMLVMHEQEMDVPPTYLNVQMEMLYSSYLRPIQIMWAGATLYAATQLLKQQGCTVNFTLTHTVSNMSGSHAIWQSSVPVPPNLDEDTFAFLFTHPATLRVLTFAQMEFEDESTRRDFAFHRRGGYGIPESFNRADSDVVFRLQNIADLFNDSNMGGNVEIAKRVLHALVDTKFQRYTL